MCADTCHIELGLGCEYARERKKRGKTSRKDLAAQAAAQAVAGQKSDDQGSKSDPGGAATKSLKHKHDDSSPTRSKNDIDMLSGENTIDALRSPALPHSSERLDIIGEMTGTSRLSEQAGIDRNHIGESTMSLSGYGAVTPGYERQEMGSQMIGAQGDMPSYAELQYSISTQSPPSFATHGSFRMSNSTLTGYPMGAGAPSPGWGISLSSPTSQFQTHIPQPSYGNARDSLRYPVLEPLLPHLSSIMPPSLACDLIDLYFASSSSAQMHPMSPYVLGFVFRKRSFLHLSKPRQCRPALLASMLWVAAQTSDASFLTSVPSARSKTCKKLLELTVALLNPLIHTPSGAPSPGGASPGVHAPDGVALGGLGVALPGTISLDALSGESGAFGAAGNLDDLATYIHLATVVSASEYKGASLRWWNAAWSLARELKLGRELPPSIPPMETEQSNSAETEGLDDHDIHRNNPNTITEEEREERRRMWWLVYIVDRHLALCYNRPLFLLDVECEGLHRPMEDTVWQAGDFAAFTANNSDPDPLNSIVRGPSFECCGHSIFGYFLPLMAILGEIVDLHHARNHPRFGICFRSAGEWDEQAAEITRHLEIYEASLKAFEEKYLAKPNEDKEHHEGAEQANSAEAGTPSVHSVHSVHTNASTRMTESDIQVRIVIAYGTHVMHVLHILLAGKWDPINLIDDEDLWISSQGFITATSHAVSAAEAINQILEFDPGLEFMPFFFGIYLLQGSFLLLLIADKLQTEASPSVVKACETIVRAHEACVVTLSTEYQVGKLCLSATDANS